ncbi:hypothetical protein E3U23_07300 [Erythrobacter litoralis]|uniref:hypothetical protein n=1 Tax=Erythrobacter litoralis TaxID=39960 RepID=UPI002434D600|nr:hypothetical protein [Erythrobacter litoralis]MDG6078996.1 hypothetical protein [Erythrobacter litoralis]
MAFAIAILLAGCSVNEATADCNGTVLTVPAEGASLPQVMAHATAMGMDRQEAETLLYLEGITPQASLEPGRTICLEGQPD